MKINRVLCLASALAAAALSHATSITASWVANNTTGITGLYTANGVQTSSTVNLDSVTSYETYDVVQSPGSTTYQPVSGVWQTELKFKFSSSGWQSVSGSTAIGVQLIHYVVSSYPNGTVSISLPQDYFQLPNAGLVTYSGSAFTFVNSYSDVNPDLFTLSQLSVDSSDSSGKTGYIIWTNCTVVNPGPWDAFPTGTTVGGSNPTTTFNGMLWAFPKAGQAGSHYSFPTAWPVYPVPVIGPLLKLQAPGDWLKL